MSLVSKLKEEFSRQKLLFSGCEKRSMYKPRLFSSPIPLAIYRCIAFIFSLSVIIVMESTTDTPGFNFYYFNTWNFLVIALYFLFATLTSGINIYKDWKFAEAQVTGINETLPLPWYMKVQWTLYNIALPTSVMVTLAYWMLLYKPGESVLSFGNISTHAANVVLMLIEEYCSRMPTRILHFYQPITYCVIYGVFNINVWGASNLVIYSLFDWTRDPGFAAGMLVATLLVYVIVHCFVFGTYLILQRFSERGTPVTNIDIPLQ